MWELLEDQKLIRTKWVYDLKRDGRGSIVRYMATLIAKGFSQIPGIDFSKVFPPVQKYATIRFMMTLSVPCGWKSTLIDVKISLI